MHHCHIDEFAVENSALKSDRRAHRSTTRKIVVWARVCLSESQRARGVDSDCVRA